MNVNSIKADTPTTSFINVADVDDKVKSELSKLEKVLNTLEGKLDRQVRTGGLSIYAYNVGGEAPLLNNGQNISAKTIYDDIESIRAEMRSITTSIPTAAQRHKLEEYQILKSKTDAKIKEIEELKKLKAKEIETAQAAKDATKVAEKNRELDNLNKELDKYTKQLSDCNTKINKYS